MGDAQAALDLGREMRVPYAIVASPDMSRDRLHALLKASSGVFANILLITDFLEFSSLWVDPVDLGGSLGLQVRQRLLEPGSRFAKLMLDSLLTLVAGVVTLPLAGLLALLVKISSPGPVFYSQERLGIGGSRFRAWKFRTMVPDAEVILNRYLAGNPQLSAEWTEHHKLRNDPRVTAIGRFLRSTSLDELPQLWNVLRGEMSLVGPRPIVDREVPRYGDAYSLVARVKPGISGLWQISGRSETGYEERVRLDSYYIRNWSIWLDIYILAKTILVVFLRRGAY